MINIEPTRTILRDTNNRCIVHLANSEVGAWPLEGCQPLLCTSPSICSRVDHSHSSPHFSPLQVAQFIILNRTQCRTLSRLQELQARGFLGWCVQMCLLVGVRKCRPHVLNSHWLLEC